MSIVFKIIFFYLVKQTSLPALSSHADIGKLWAQSIRPTLELDNFPSKFSDFHFDAFYVTPKSFYVQWEC